MLCVICHAASAPKYVPKRDYMRERTALHMGIVLRACLAAQMRAARHLWDASTRQRLEAASLNLVLKGCALVCFM